FSLCLSVSPPRRLYALSLHDALPICAQANMKVGDYEEAVTDCNWAVFLRPQNGEGYYLRALANIKTRDFSAVCRDSQKATNLGLDRKSTRLNSSHVKISYAVFCLKKK